MATQTNNYNLTKPSYSDPADIDVINENMDKLDAHKHSINGVEFDGSGNATVYSPNELAVVRNTLPGAKGWLRVFRLEKQGIYDISFGGSDGYITAYANVKICIINGSSADFTQLKCVSTSGYSSGLMKVRFVRPSGKAYGYFEIRYNIQGDPANVYAKLNTKMDSATAIAIPFEPSGTTSSDLVDEFTLSTGTVKSNGFEGDFIISSPNNTKYKISVSDTGTLSARKI